jgi:NAD(P)H-hydrate epimerase
MRLALTAEQTRALESAAMERAGVSVDDLMARVGRAVAEESARMAGEGHIAVVAGKGNNGGDGWAAARELLAMDREVEVLALAGPDELSGAAERASREAEAAGVRWRRVESAAELSPALEGAALVVDAVFGFGVEGPVREPFASAIDAVNDADAVVLSVDLPSGVESDTGRAEGAAVVADATLAVMSEKVGHVLHPGAALSGEVLVADLGLGSAADAIPGTPLETWTPPEYAELLPIMAPDDHKGSRGRLVIVGGSEGMTGSVVLAASAALRSGAGYVLAAVPASVVDVIDAGVVPAVVRPLPETSERAVDSDATSHVLELASDADAVVVGPGLTTGEGASDVVRALVESYRGPLVLDADALNVVAELGLDSLRARAGATVLTPHPGEAARLLGSTAARVQADRAGAAAGLARTGSVCLLKGAGTVVAYEDTRVVNRTGNPGMATLGTGDVLAGVLGALLAQGLLPLEAAALAAYVHGLAGDVAAAGLTPVAMHAGDVVDALPFTFAGLLDTFEGDAL